MTLRILVAVDVEHPESWTAAAAELGRLFGLDRVELHALYVLPEIGASLVGAALPEGFEREALETARRDLGALVARGPAAAAHVAHGPVDGEILSAARRLDVDLLAALAPHDGFAERLLGSHAEALARGAELSVLLLRPRGG
jgi:nucleotide-binding universal stress UspA family protein